MFRLLKEITLNILALIWLIIIVSVFIWIIWSMLTSGRYDDTFPDDYLPDYGNIKIGN